MVARSDIMVWEAGSHASTFGGNPVSCSAALATIELLEAELMENAKIRGEYLMTELPGVAEVNGMYGRCAR